MVQKSRQEITKVVSFVKMTQNQPASSTDTHRHVPKKEASLRHLRIALIRLRDLSYGSGADLLRAFDLIKLPYFLYVFGKRGLSKQCRPRSDAAEPAV